MTREEILRLATPAARLLGREVVTIDDAPNGVLTIRFTAQPEFLNRHGTVQGGLLSAMLDSATALALYAALPPDQTGLTVNLNVSFLKPARQGILTATTRLDSRDERTAQTRAELQDAEGVVVASAVATLRIVPRQR